MTTSFDKEMNMRFKQYLKEGSIQQRTNNIISICESINIKKSDNSIKKISNDKYLFSVDDFKYNFGIIGDDFGDFTMYSIYYTDATGSIDRKNELSILQAKRVIEKVITCIIMFIDSYNPDVFTFSTDNDDKLHNFYTTIIRSLYKKKPFTNFTITNTGNGYRFIKNNIKEEMVKIYEI